MIHKDSLKEKWILEVARQHKSDPILVEKVVRALYLLEHLQNSGLEFIFKGGTALMLLFKEPKRFSIDIDIIVSKKPDNMRETLDVVLNGSDFLEYKTNERKSKSNIEKEHYKFYYKPVTNARAEKEYILLDVLYEKSHYGKHINGIEINSPFIKSEGKNVKVKVPISEAILGDKLTAFAPNTTGVPYKRGKELEIVKQLFDVSKLIQSTDNVNVVNSSFLAIAKNEIQYRKLSIKGENVLEDIFETALLISKRERNTGIQLEKFNEIKTGLLKISTYTIGTAFRIDEAIQASAIAAWFAMKLKNGNYSPIEVYAPEVDLTNFLIENQEYQFLNKLKKANKPAFYYWYKCLEESGILK